MDTMEQDAATNAQMDVKVARATNIMPRVQADVKKARLDRSAIKHAQESVLSVRPQKIVKNVKMGILCLLDGHVNNVTTHVNCVPLGRTVLRAALMKDRYEDTVPAVVIGGVVAAVVIFASVITFGVFINLRRRNREPTTELVHGQSGNEDNASAPVYATVARCGKQDNTGMVYANTPSVEANTATGHDPVYTNDTRNLAIVTTEESLEIDQLDNIARQNAIRFEEDGGVYYNNDREVKKFKIPVDELKKFVISKNVNYFKTEFEKLPYGLLKDYTVSQMKANIAMNRYKGIYPYDDHRVRVPGGNTDYINASFIDTEKCEQYWPNESSSQMFGDVRVLCQSEKHYAEFTRRTFTIEKEEEERTLHHLHFTSWPDKDVPDDVTSIIDFRHKVLHATSVLGGPTIVHCSAGIGRTGTYIAIDILTKEGESERAVDIAGCVLNMRQNRPNMVQTAVGALTPLACYLQ
ncbi:receptor-type tyrosine-protein phosphatase T-like [Dreissena polymorpha]|uniref:receptor-type tyrosine-protein phosphatase T-like n=1 Tax=Dreissena polymorpha TaxID=45954 RepID=UPI00226491EB|nr:receptor-type tyrosine-protein phosphatase T-like [Dreissena polymorpha]